VLQDLELLPLADVSQDEIIGVLLQAGRVDDGIFGPGRADLALADFDHRGVLASLTRELHLRIFGPVALQADEAIT
jgi:hypothetical protein